MDFFRFGKNFRLTVARMDIVKGAALRDELGALPLTKEPTAGEPGGYTIPEDDTHIRWWAAAVVGNQALFAICMIVGKGEKLNGYQHDGEQTDECLQDCVSDTSTDTGSGKRNNGHWASICLAGMGLLRL